MGKGGIMQFDLDDQLGMGRDPGGGGGGRGYSSQMLAGMCHGKVKNGQGLRNELPVECENACLTLISWYSFIVPLNY